MTKARTSDLLIRGILILVFAAILAAAAGVFYAGRDRGGAKAQPKPIRIAKPSYSDYKIYYHGRYQYDFTVNTKAVYVVENYLAYRNHKMSYEAFDHYVKQVGALLQSDQSYTTTVPSTYASFDQQLTSTVEAERKGIRLLKDEHGIELDAMVDELHEQINQFSNVASSFPRPSGQQFS